ncbi:two-component system histidine kinase PnpS [Tuberibacillus sp. Marseille-P3662]|uniref:two-component system histidine kinase PnpS n=1 Tax=Tuberibacillus sp. Marseille-P3662 TaxID=1965358 RepID=UPI000A1CDDAA|nr:ATP-binding protein [Tuberibacillus sp. Marseille-P3662]
MRKSLRISLAVIVLTGCLLMMNELIQTANVRQYKHVVKDRLEAVKAFVVENETLMISEERSNLNQFAAETDEKLVLYGPKGDILYQSSPTTKDFQPFAASEQYQQADHQFGYAQSLKTADGHLLGYIKLKGDIPKLKGLFTLYFIIFLAGILFIFGYERFTRRFTKPLRDATDMAESLAVRAYETRISETGELKASVDLNRSLNTLARNLEKMTKSYQLQQDRLRTLIENIGSGLIFIDQSGQINLVNKTYQETFRQTTQDWINDDYQHAIPQQEVVEVIDETFLTEQRMSRQLRLPIHIERRHFDVSSVPILNNQQKLHGILVVFHDITELKKLEKVRRDFVANVSHELKTPVTSITGFAETLLDDGSNDDELTKSFLTIILNESKRLQTLIHDLLDLSKIEQDQFQISWDSVDIKTILDEIMLILKGKAEEKQIDLHIRHADPVHALGDAYRIRQIVINLINNAIAYTPEGGHVYAAIYDGGDHVQFQVSDTGIGIDEKQVPRIFERFYRVDKARSRDSGGTGLGLAIVKHLVEAHEGKINVGSVPGEGTTFTIVFKKSEIT